MNILKSRATGVIGFVVAIIVWYVVAESRIYTATLLPDPTQTFHAIWSLFYSGSLIQDIGLTLYRTANSFAFSALVGIPIGLFLGYSKTAYSIFQPLVDFFRSIPATALFPLFILFFGINDLSVFAAVVFGNLFLIILNSTYGVHNAKKSRILFARSMNASQIQIFRKIVFFEALPYVFVGLRQALSLSLVIVIVTEMFFGSANGLGYKIYNFSLLYKTPESYGVMIVVGIMGYLINLGFVEFERKAVHWAGK